MGENTSNNDDNKESTADLRGFPGCSGAGLIGRRDSLVLLPVNVIVVFIVVRFVSVLVAPTVAAVCFRVFGFRATPSDIVLPRCRRRCQTTLSYSGKTNVVFNELQQ